MLSIHDPETIKNTLAGKAVWLCPVDHVHDTNYLLAALVRIEAEFQNLAPNRPCKALDDLRKFQQDAVIFQQDTARYHHFQPEVGYIASKGMNINNIALGKILDDLSQVIGHDIVWCLPFADFDLHFAKHLPFLKFLVKFNFPNMVIFLVRDESVQLSEPYERANTIIGTDTQEMYDLYAEIKPTLQPPLLPVVKPPVVKPTEGWGMYDCDGKKPAKKKQPRPAHRSIDEE